jgi:hypothetical protein
MATQLQLRRGTTTEHTSFTGAVGEVTVDTTKDVLVVHDGATAGGFPQAAKANADGTISLIKKDGTSAGSINSSGLFNNTLTSTSTDQALTAAQGKVLQDAKLDKDSISATGSAPYFVCRAWVNFNAVPLNGTYSQSGTTVTVTMTAHGMSVGQNVNLSITSGTALSGSYPVATVIDANIFTYTAATSLTTSGNITRNLFIRASGNVLGITDNGVGDYTINFTTALPDSNYAVSYSSGQLGGGQHAGKLVSLSAGYVNVRQEQDNSNSYPASDPSIITVAVFR